MNDYERLAGTFARLSYKLLMADEGKITYNWRAVQP